METSLQKIPFPMQSPVFYRKLISWRPYFHALACTYFFLETW